jgi:hypothetical protein
VVVGSTGFTPIVDLLWADGALLALTDAGEFLRSNDRGATWQAVGTISQVGMRAVTIGATGFAAVSKQGDVAISADGASWSWGGTVNQVFVVALAPSTPEFTTSVPPPAAPIEPVLSLSAWPNPFRGELSLSIAGGSPSDRTIVGIYDVTGRRVARIEAVGGAPRQATLSWIPGASPAGVYFVQARSGGRIASQSVTLVR